jgi:hypothetical protein
MSAVLLLSSSRMESSSLASAWCSELKCDFHPFSERVNSDEQLSETTWSLGQDAHDVNSPDCKRLEDINRPKRIDMLRRLLLEELAISAFLHDFHCIIHRGRPVKSVPKGFTNDRAPWWVWSTYTLVYIFQQLYAFFSRDTFHHHPISTMLIQHPINQMIHSRLACNALNFSVIIWWRLIVQVCPNRAHSIICWLLRWLINNHQLRFHFTDWFFCFHWRLG